MSDLNVDHSTDGEPLPAGTSNYEPPSYEIAAEDQPILDEILAADPLTLPGPVTVTGDLGKIPARRTLADLKGTPYFEAVERQLAAQPAGSRSADVEHDLVMQALTENSLDLRAKMGFAADAPPVFREWAALNAQVAQLEREYLQLTKDLSAIAGYETRSNAQSGKPEAVPIPLYGPERQRQMFRRLEEIQRIIPLLQPGGWEHDRRMAKAKFESVELVKAHRAQAEMNAKVEARAKALVEEDEIERRARAKARIAGAELKDH